MAFSISDFGTDEIVVPNQAATITVSGTITTTVGYVKLENVSGTIIAAQTITGWDDTANTIDILVQQRNLRYGDADSLLRVTLADYATQTLAGITLNPESGVSYQNLVSPGTGAGTISALLGVVLLDGSQVAWRDINSLGVAIAADGAVTGTPGPFYVKTWDPATQVWSSYVLADSSAPGFDLSMIGPIVGFPSIYPDSFDVEVMRKQTEFQSDLSGVITTAELPGTRWKFTLQFGKRGGREARTLSAFLISLRGMAGRFNITVANFAPLNGTALGSPTVKGANQTGNALVTDGWQSGQLEALAVGDYFSVNGELKMVTSPTVPDGTGTAVIQFEPSLHQAPPDNGQIITQQPSCRVKLVKPFSFSLTSPVLYGITVDAVEAIDA
jgi:hypothetical protein